MTACRVLGAAITTKVRKTLPAGIRLESLSATRYAAENSAG